MSVEKLPALPECDSYCTHKDSHEYDVWSAEQMHAYGLACRQQALEEAITVFRYWFGQEPSRVSYEGRCLESLRALSGPKGQGSV